jgi:hypothetical protein
MATRDRAPSAPRSNANVHFGADLIVFAIPGPGVHTIRLRSELPALVDTVTIDGYTQPGSRPNTLFDGDDAVILIELSGEDAPAGARGLVLTHDGCTVRARR